MENKEIMEGLNEGIVVDIYETNGNTLFKIAGGVAILTLATFAGIKGYKVYKKFKNRKAKNEVVEAEIIEKNDEK